MKLSPNFSEDCFVHSQVAQRNSIDNSFALAVHRDNAMMLCNEYLEPVRARLDVPIIITSGYRRPAVNRLIGGAKNSSHQYGRAVDMVIVKKPLKELFNTIITMEQARELPTFDQLIWEFGWIHLGIAAKPRKQILQAIRKNSQITYKSITKAP